MGSGLLLRDLSATTRRKASNIKNITAKEDLDVGESDCYGLFATENLEKNDIIFREETVLCDAKFSRGKMPSLLQNLTERSPICRNAARRLTATRSAQILLSEPSCCWFVKWHSPSSTKPSSRRPR